MTPANALPPPRTSNQSPRKEGPLQLGARLFASGNYRESETAYRNAIELAPDSAGAHLGLGHVLKTLGKSQQAITAYRRARQLRPNSGAIHFSLSNLKTFVFDDEEVQHMKERLESGALDRESIVHFAFALGKAFEDSGDYDRAFAYYARANRVHRLSLRYDPVRTAAIHARIREVFSGDLLRRCSGTTSGARDQGPVPLFILGLPRSGSTLLEQILASHSAVEGTGELTELSRAARSLDGPGSTAKYPEAIAGLSAGQLRGLGDAYLAGTLPRRTGAAYFIDKMPNNFAHIGLIQLILPNAKIIDARRHPLDSCMGCFKQHFHRGQSFSSDLLELGGFYLEYRQMMDHWDAVLPGKVLHVQYEDVVSDLETQLRRILDHCGLPHEAACLDFHQTKRPVRSASAQQVRQPLYADSINNWKHFSKHLDPLIQVLSPVLAAG